jgi:hypothetical protein
MDDYLMDRMAEYVGGVMVIQYTLAACLDEADIISKASLAKVLRKSTQDEIQEPGAADAINLFVDVLEGNTASPDIAKPDWLKGVIDGGKKSDDE